MSSDVDQLASDGWDKYFDEKYDEAVDFFQKSLKKDPEYVYSLRGLALSYLELGSLELAVLTIRKATLIDVENAEIWHDLGGILEEQDELDEAQLAYIKATDLEPKNSDYLISWGLLELNRDQFVMAEYAISEAVRHNIEDPECWQQLALVYQIQGRKKESKDAMKEADCLMDAQKIPE